MKRISRSTGPVLQSFWMIKCIYRRLRLRRSKTHPPRQLYLQSCQVSLDRRKQLLRRTRTPWAQVRRLTPALPPLLQMELPTSAKSIAPPHWTEHAHSGFSARPDHSIPPVVSIQPIDLSLVSTSLPSSSFRISSSFLTPPFLS